MASDKEDRIRAKAHEIWLSEGSPEGSDTRHWEMATTLVEAEDAAEAPPAPAPKKPRAPRARKPAAAAKPAPEAEGTAEAAAPAPKKPRAPRAKKTPPTAA